MRVEVSGEDHHEDIDLVDEYAECRNNKAVEVLAGPTFKRQEDSAEKFGTVKPFEWVSAC
jgi:hydroxypyruvate isomerase